MPEPPDGEPPPHGKAHFSWELTRGEEFQAKVTVSAFGHIAIVTSALILLALIGAGIYIASLYLSGS